MLDRPIQIEYTVPDQQLLDLSLASASDSRKSWRWVTWSAAGVLGWLAFESARSGDWVSGVLLMIWAVLIIVDVPLRWMLPRLRRHATGETHCSISMDSVGIRGSLEWRDARQQRRSTSRVDFPWTKLKAIEDVGQGVLLAFGGQRGIFVPFSAFDPAQVHAFLAHLSEVHGPRTAENRATSSHRANE